MIFHSYVSLPEGTNITKVSRQPHVGAQGPQQAWPVEALVVERMVAAAAPGSCQIPEKRGLFKSLL